MRRTLYAGVALAAFAALASSMSFASDARTAPCGEQQYVYASFQPDKWQSLRMDLIYVHYAEAMAMAPRRIAITAEDGAQTFATQAATAGTGLRVSQTWKPKTEALRPSIDDQFYSI